MFDVVGSIDRDPYLGLAYSVGRVVVKKLNPQNGCQRKKLGALDETKAKYMTDSTPGPHQCCWSRGCLGCCAKSQPTIAVDEPSKGLRIQGRLVKKPSISEDFWSTSTYEMDNSTIQSQRSMSSISISNQSVSQCSGAGNNSNHSEFVNHGFLLWNQTRLQWMGSKQPENRKQVQEPVLNWNATYESLLGTNKRFPQPIPLSEMVDFLVDIWDQEGLYD